MMDRLVCADGGNPDPTTTHGKKADEAKALERAVAVAIADVAPVGCRSPTARWFRRAQVARVAVACRIDADARPGTPGGRAVGKAPARHVPPPTG
jgi:hypothetical protein